MSTATPGPRTGARRGPYRKSAARRSQIVAAAMDAFAANGYRAGSLKDIAERVGIDQSTIFHYFATKEALLLEVMEARDRAADELIASLHPETAEDVPRVLLELARHNANTPGVIELYSVLAAESLTPDHPLSEYFRNRTRRLREGFSAWFTLLDEAGRLRAGVTPADAAAAFLALWEGAQVHWLMDRDAVDVTEQLAQYLRLVVVDVRVD